MYPDAHLYLHRTELAARDRVSLHRPGLLPRPSGNRFPRLRGVLRRRTSPERRLRKRAAFSPR